MIGIGHNRPVFDLRRKGHISCDWITPKKAAPRPRHFVSYWRIYRDGKLIDSFTTKKRALRALQRYQEL